MMSRRLRLAMLLCGLLAAAATLAQEQSDSAPAAPPASEAKIATPLRVRVSSGVQSGLLIKKVAPKYPDEARRAGIQGTVVLKATISKQGDIVDLQPVSGDPELTKAAIKAVKKWKYKPYILGGNPVMVETTIQVNYALANR